MKAKLKDGRILPIEKKSVISLDDNGKTLEVKVEDIESFESSDINWEKLRIDIAMELLRKFDSDIVRSVSFESYLVNKADKLIEKLNGDM